MSWQFSEEAFLKQSPSRKQLTLQQDLKTRESIYDFTIKLGLALKLNGKTILAATIYVARFYMRVPITTSKYFVVCAAITISCKLNDNYRPPDKIAMTACALKNPHKQIDEQSDLFWSWRDQLLYREEMMLKTLNFDLNLNLPYELREKLEEEIIEKEKIKKLEDKDDEDEHSLKDVNDLVGDVDDDDEEEVEASKTQAHSAIVKSDFYTSAKEILRQSVALIEILSSLPILITYNVETFFGASLVIVLFEKYSTSVTLPKDYLTKHVHTTPEESYKCYKYIYKLLKLSQSKDPHLVSHRAAYKRIKLIERKDFFHITNSEMVETSTNTEASNTNGTPKDDDNLKL